MSIPANHIDRCFRCEYNKRALNLNNVIVSFKHCHR